MLSREGSYQVTDSAENTLIMLRDGPENAVSAHCAASSLTSRHYCRKTWLKWRKDYQRRIPTEEELQRKGRESSDSTYVADKRVWGIDLRLAFGIRGVGTKGLL